MFYSFSQFFANQRPSALYQEFLQREGVTLEQILEHEDTLTELSKGNRELLGCLQSKVPGLLQWISREEEQESRKAPFVAANILTSDAFMNEFNSDSMEFPLFFSFLQAEYPLSPTIAGYSVRTCLKLMERQEAQVAEFLLLRSQPYSPLLLSHLKSRAVADLVYELLCVSRLTEERQTLLAGVVRVLGETKERQVAVNAGWVAAEIVRRSDHVSEWKRIAGVLLSEEVLMTFARVITSDIAGDQAATVLSLLAAHYSFPELYESLLVSPGNQSNSRSILTNLLETALNFLQTPIPASPSPTTCGNTTPSLGSTRLQLIHLVLSCMKSVGPALDPLLQSTHFMETVTKLFLAYPWHSSLHIAYADIVKTVLEGPSVVLKTILMEDVRLVELLGCLGNTCFEGLHRKGYMGQITQMGNMLLTVSIKNPYFSDFLAEEIWTDFCKKYLFPQTKLENTQFLASPKSAFSKKIDDFPAAEEKIANEAVIPFTLEELDQQNPFDLWGDDDLPILDDLSDLYGAVDYWKVPIRRGELEELE